MKRRAILMAVFPMLCFVSSCQKQPEPATHIPDVKADMAAIREVIGRWVELYNVEDFDGVMSLYAEEAVLMAPNAAEHKGKAEILRAYERDAKANEEHVNNSIIEDIKVSGDLGVARGEDSGTTKPRNGDDLTRYSLKWLIVLERQPDNSWKFICEIWNDNGTPTL